MRTSKNTHTITNAYKLKITNAYKHIYIYMPVWYNIMYLYVHLYFIYILYCMHAYIYYSYTCSRTYTIHTYIYAWIHTYTHSCILIHIHTYIHDICILICAIYMQTLGRCIRKLSSFSTEGYRPKRLVEKLRQNVTTVCEILRLVSS